VKQHIIPKSLEPNAQPPKNMMKTVELFKERWNLLQNKQRNIQLKNVPPPRAGPSRVDLHSLVLILDGRRWQHPRQTKNRLKLFSNVCEQR
jgi:hypothetical protein